MRETRRATVYFHRDIHLALTRKAAQAEQSISDVVNEAVRLTLAEDEEDLKAFRERADEPNLDFAKVVKSLKRRGKL
ncbi:MAG TPA: CopG family transcriptional regulator [Blastocatellia bacterium]|nr:CopG family transcriptional regulator [Blastocatellia bacterium]